MTARKNTGSEEKKTDFRWWIPLILALLTAFAGAYSKVETKADRVQLDDLQKEITSVRVLTAETKASIEGHTRTLDRLQTQLDAALRALVHEPAPAPTPPTALEGRSNALHP